MAIQQQTLSNTFFEWLTQTNALINYVNEDKANLAYGQANIAPDIANSYARTVGTAGNTYTVTVGAAANSYAVTVGAATNNYVQAVGAAANSYTQTSNNFTVAYAQTVGTAGNNYTVTVGAGVNSYARTVGSASNTYAQTVGTAGNNYTNTVGAAANTRADTALAVGQGAFGQANTARTLANTAIQNNTTTLITTGYSVNSFFAGTFSSGTWTPNAANGNYQYLTANGAFTVAAPSTNTAIDVLFTNGIAANTITFSGYTGGTSNGDPLTTTSGHRFMVSLRRINNISMFMIKALQ